MNGFVICGKPQFSGNGTKIALGELCEILNGYAFKSKRYVDEGIRVIRIANVQKGYLEDSHPCFYPATEKGSIAQFLLYENDLLLSLTGNVGRVALLDNKFLPAALNQRVACLRIKDESLLNKRYLFHCLNSMCFENRCIESANGVAQKNLSTVWLRGYAIPVPQMDKQLEIARRFDLIQAQISRAKAQIVKLDALVKSRFNEMFGGCSAKVGADWPSVPISEVVQKPKSGEWGEEDLDGDGIKVLRTTNFTDTGVVDYAKVVTRQIDRKKLTNKGLKHGDILIEKSGGSDKKPVGRVVLFEGEDNVCLNNNFTAALRIKDATEVDYRYLFHFMYMNYWQGGTRSFESKTTGLHNLKLGDYLAKTKIAVPPIGDQRDFSAFVCQVDKLRFMLLGNPSPIFGHRSFCCSTNSGNGGVILEAKDY